MTARAIPALAVALAAAVPGFASDAVILRYAPPAQRVAYDAKFDLAAKLRVAPGSEIAHPYIGQPRMRAGGTARLYIALGGVEKGAAPVIFVRSADVFVEGFDSRLEAKLATDKNGPMMTVRLNGTEISSERLSSNAPPSTGADGGVRLTAPAQGAADAASILQLVVWQAVAALVSLPDKPVSQGEEWGQAIELPTATTAPSAAPEIVGTLAHRLAAVDNAAKMATVEFTGQLSPAPGRALFEMPLPTPAGAQPLLVTVALDQTTADITGSLTLPLAGGLPVTAEGVIEGTIRATIGSDDPDWQGRKVVLSGDGRLACSVRRVAE